MATILFAARFCVSTIFEGNYNLREAFISLRDHRHQQWLDKIRMSNTVMNVRRCQDAQLLNPACNHGNESYDTNSPRASPATIVRNYSHVCACAMYATHGYYLRAASI